ncbi:MAG: hypothetical protein JXA19_05610 [Anaerolineales bacterium]|nr:hypothetical protein [Anaerolineales bacterium]
MTASRELTGWLLSVYPDELDGAVVWLLSEDGSRLRLTQPFPTTFYISGKPEDLNKARRYLRGWRYPPEMEMTERQELYNGRLPVLSIRVDNPVTQQRLFYEMKKHLRWLYYYDAKIPFSIRYCAAREIFPMAQCRLQIDEHQNILDIRALDDPWDTVYDLPPLRVMGIEPDNDPRHAQPKELRLLCDENEYQLSMADGRRFLKDLQSLLDDFDPDVLFARWGDSWLFPTLFAMDEELHVNFNPSRDARQKYQTKQESTFESYGSLYFRSTQTYLYGRWHIDPRNSTMDMGFEFSMRSAIELARVTCVEVQAAARNSPGSGFTAMQIREAMRRGILIPLHKRQTERYKSALELNNADGGGLNYRPIYGLHENVAEVDFFSMYPSIMMKWNISGETVGARGENTRYVPDSGAPIRQDVSGLVASVLTPLLEKRLAVKKLMHSLPDEDPLRPILKSIADALKWLGYVSFGYQGYKNNLFGNIAAHEAICAIGRETLVSAIEVAQEMGFRVLAANVDSLFVQKKGCHTPQNFLSLCEAILTRTNLIIELEGIFDWIIFQPSRLNPHIGAANRYFGKYNHGGIKVRGMAQRRSDTAPWIANGEREIMELLATEREAERLRELIPRALEMTRAYFRELDEERVPLEDLVCQTKLSREVDQYRGNSTSAQAAHQLAKEGKQVRVGQRVKFIYTHGRKTSIFAWDLPLEPDYALINKARYKELLLYAVEQILLPLGLDEKDLSDLVFEYFRQLALWPEEEWERLRVKVKIKKAVIKTA